MFPGNGEGFRNMRNTRNAHSFIDFKHRLTVVAETPSPSAIGCVAFGMNGTIGKVGAAQGSEIVFYLLE